ncbi:hypothetical protein HWB92_gp009 [Serratia phage vB_SmaA_3M]|uniref:Uncharacterized protein n=1 Tax=Serratia phage vB_SmaA_3M TaxID=2419930 RepID=A0A3G2YRZ6_9CAUD|nr:hypothetical protein HWB92_gp009 [Serratia phage vB_SmaA_3M]AYP28267.1 hypothetical protein 3M_009c [Serratia phage vB_SmaA_3M]
MRHWEYDENSLRLRVIRQRVSNPNDKRSPRQVMDDLGIQYESHIPLEQWNEHVFTGCTVRGVPICHMWVDLDYWLPGFVEIIDCP